MDVKEIAC